MHILILEDDPLIGNDLAEKLDQLGYKDTTLVHSIKDAKVVLEESTIGLAIVDIELRNGETGIEFGSVLGNLGIPFFYLSGMQDTITFFNAAQTQAAANIPKPISLTTLRNTLHSTFNSGLEKVREKQKVFVPTNEGELLVKVDDILYLRASRSYCEVQLQQEYKPRLVSLPMSQMLDKIDATAIVRIHRSHAININKVTVRKGNLLITNPEFPPLEIGKKYRDKIHQLLNTL